MRYTIAHFLGNYALHNQYEYSELYKIENQECFEIRSEANEFVDSLLMPKTLFITKYSQLEKNIVDVANFFLVSIRAAEIRSWRLGLNNCF